MSEKDASLLRRALLHARSWNPVIVEEALAIVEREEAKDDPLEVRP